MRHPTFDFITTSMMTFDEVIHSAILQEIDEEPFDAVATLTESAWHPRGP